MTYTNFPFGITSLGVPVIGSGPTIPVTTGNYWFVNSATGNTGGPGTIDQPYSTLASLYSNSGIAANDVVIIAAGHTESIIAAGGITTSVAGVQIVGMGTGAKRPTFTWSTSTAATWLISGASTKISNIVCVCNIDQVVTGFSITAASVTLGTPGYPVEWQDSATNKEAVVGVTATGANLTVNLTYRGQTGGSHCTAAVSLNGVANGLINCDFYGKASTAWVNFVTTACTDIEVYGYMYNSGTTNYTKDVVDTITGSTWFASFYDGAAGFAISGGSGSALGPAAAATVIADLAVPSADSTANVYERDAIGNKTDAIVYVAGTTKSLMAYIKGIADLQERVAVSATAILADGTTIFTIAGGPIQIVSLISECVVGGDSAASTVQYSATATGLTAQTISGASGSVANAGARATVTLIGTALSTAAVYNSKGTNLGMTNSGGVVVNVGIMTTVIGTANTTTGTWRHIMRYRPLTTAVTVS